MARLAGGLRGRRGSPLVASPCPRAEAERADVLDLPDLHRPESRQQAEAGSLGGRDEPAVAAGLRRGGGPSRAAGRRSPRGRRDPPEARRGSAPGAGLRSRRGASRARRHSAAASTVAPQEHVEVFRFASQPAGSPRSPGARLSLPRLRPRSRSRGAGNPAQALVGGGDDLSCRHPGALDQGPVGVPGERQAGREEGPSPVVLDHFLVCPVVERRARTPAVGRA